MNSPQSGNKGVPDPNEGGDQTGPMSQGGPPSGDVGDNMGPRKPKNRKKERKPPKINVEFVRAHGQQPQSSPIYAIPQSPSPGTPPSNNAPPYTFNLTPGSGSSSSPHATASTYYLQQPGAQTSTSGAQTSASGAHSPHSHLCLCEENCPRSPYCTPACCGAKYSNGTLVH